MRYHELIFEGFAKRYNDPAIVPWLVAACKRIDADDLFLHGSDTDVASYTDPDTSIGRMIFATKLTNDYHPPSIPLNNTYQAEHYGSTLFLIKIRPRNMFKPLNDPKAMEIVRKTNYTERFS